MAKKDIAVAAFCVWNVLALAVWYLPLPGARAALLPVFAPYLNATGLCQDFYVFSPDVNTTYAEISGIVRMRDGTTVIWQYPRIVEMNLWQKMVKERYRAYATTVLSRSNNYLLPAMSSHIARDVYQRCGRKSRPQSVTIRVNWHEVAPPEHAQTAKSGVVDIYQSAIEEHAPL